MFRLHFADRGIELVQLTLQHVLGRARVTYLELPNDSGASLFIDPRTHLRSIVRQAVHGRRITAIKSAISTFS